MLKEPITNSCLAHAKTTYAREYEAYCGGFTLDEFLALDIGAMDLSEFVDTLSEEAKGEFHKLWN